LAGPQRPPLSALCGSFPARASPPMGTPRP
jgi:hypothetical protein